VGDTLDGFLNGYREDVNVGLAQMDMGGRTEGREDSSIKTCVSPF